MAIAGLLLCGCASVPMPPPTTPFPPRTEVPVESYHFRAAVMDFTDQTGRAGDLVKTIPDILTTALFKLNRIDLYQREPLRGAPPQEAKTLVQNLMDKRVIDGVITGTITQLSGLEKQVVLELRLISRNQAVMYAEDHTLSFGGRRVMEIDRKDVFAVAQSVTAAVPPAKEIRIANRVGGRVTLERGADAGLIAGMTGYVQAALEKIADPVTGEAPKPAYVIVGEIVIDQVTHDSAIGRIIAGDDIRARDLVRLK
ncbi:MAG: hypothetical protein AB1515_09070 [Nitrospirota bacterium]